MLRYNKDLFLEYPIVIFILAILIRLPIAYITTGASPDIESYNLIGRNILQGNLNPYNFGRYPYPPFWMIFEALMVWATALSGLPFYFIAKLPGILFDAGIAVLILKILDQYKFADNFHWSLIYIFNPISLLVVAGHGQFDSIPLFFLLLSVYYFSNQKLMKSAFSLGFGIFAKIYPILALPFFISKIENLNKKLIYSIFSLSIVIISLLPYLISTPKLVIREVFLYSSWPDFGYSSIIGVFMWLKYGTFEIPSFISQLGKILVLTGIGGLWYYNSIHKHPNEKLIVLIFLIFYIFSAGIGAQYLLWIVPFAILLRTKILKYYFFLGTGALIGFYLLKFPGALGLSKDYIYNSYAATIYYSFNICWWLLCIYWAINLWTEPQKVDMLPTKDLGDSE